MKKFGLVLLLVALLVAILPVAAFADGPSPIVSDEMLYAASCTEQGVIDGLLILQAYTSQYGALHQLASPQGWVNAYPHILNNFAQDWGCAPIFYNPGDKDQRTNPIVAVKAPWLRVVWFAYNIKK